MREILFRAKRISDGEWVEGYYAIARDRRGLEQHNILITDNKHGYFGWHEINPETVCQFTGLHDKNGNKIWENDIVGFEDTGEDGYEYKEGFEFQNRAKVVFRKGRCELSDFLSDNSYTLENMNDHEELFNLWKYSEVIGTIFDNPELLKGGI